MVKLLKVLPSKKAGKKYTAYFIMDDGKEKIVHFGATGYRDYILINDKNSKWYLPKILDRNVTRDSYRRRHKKDLETNDPTRPGYLSYYILWDLKTLAGSIKKFKNKFKLN
tara:strand:- start:1833 stop:2165 length:333 start_codon:yes stop_codon:yes gene_type:complete